MTAPSLPSSATRPLLFLLGEVVERVQRSGIHRVAVETARAFAETSAVDFVRWDLQAGGLRYADAEELDLLFGPGDWPAGARVPPTARQVGRTFGDVLAGGADWLLIPEVAWNQPDGNEALARIITQTRQYGLKVAAIFYDLIPITNPLYGYAKAEQAAYMAELVRADLILPISADSAAKLAAYWAGQGIEPIPPIAAVLLPDGGRAPPATVTTEDPLGQPGLLLLGTIEPRKRQVEFLRAFEAARRRSPVVAGYRVTLVGGVNPAVAEPFRRLVAQVPGVEHLDYAGDRVIADRFARARFSAFVSDDEGYGLPIAESLQRGVPCLCADFGSMAEVAAGGGCLVIDVRDPAALEQAIIDLCEQAELRAYLRADIGRRAFRTWRDYAAELASRLDRSSVQSAPVNAALARGQAETMSRLSAETILAVAKADVLGFDSAAARSAFIQRAAEIDVPTLLPTRMPVGKAEFEAEQATLGRDQAERLWTAAVEAAYRTARQALSSPPRPRLLRLMISTYNRRDFVVENVRWLLKTVLRRIKDVDLVVFDGGSTDGTVEALEEMDDPRLRIFASPVRLGMLEGWRVASRLEGAEYIWVVGDDDFIVPDQFAAVLEGVRRNAGVPFGVVNFNIYHRAAWSPADGPADLIREGRPIAPPRDASGLLPVREIAVQNDNLFTAIYTIVWRADVFAAAYDHAFDGPPFGNMTEAIPCTEIILERFGACEAYWHGPAAIVGNAHNSWSRWRPRWHGLVMPTAIARAREIGVDPTVLEPWARLHRRLFHEAAQIAADQGAPLGLEGLSLDLSERVLREDLLGADGP